MKLLDIDPNLEEEEGSSMDADAAASKGKSAVIKTSTRQVGKSIVLLIVCPVDGVFARDWPGGPHKVEARRSCGCQQGQLPHPRYTPARVTVDLIRH